MKIAIIVNNYGLKYDGIGSYGELECEYLKKFDEVIVYSANCLNKGVLRRVFNFGMTHCFIKAYRNFNKDDADIYLIEYPFVEWNPFFLLSFLLLKSRVKNNRKKIVLSLHEFERVKYLRKLVINFLCKNSNHILASNESIIRDVTSLNNDLHLRQLPSTLYNEKIIMQNVKKDKNLFVFFGLINKSKAFEEMINSWCVFNRTKDKRIYILSSSFLDSKDFTDDIIYKYMCDDEEILEIMMKCAFCINPIIPNIDEKNSTFKTATTTGCITIGKFGETFKNLDFVIDMDDYSEESFIKSFDYVHSFSDEKINLLSESAKDYSKSFIPENCLKKTRDILLDILK